MHETEGMTTGWKRWAIASVALAAGAVTAVLAFRSPDGLRSASSIGSLVATLVPLVLGLVLWARRPPPVALATATPEQVDAAQRQLASQVLSQWRDEIGARQLDDPGPLAVRWRFTDLDVVDAVEHVARERPLRFPRGRGRHRFTGRADHIDKVAGEFRGLKRRRMVILGEPGMGKTTLALLLLRELLEHPGPDDPVPVLLSMSGWDAATESLAEWLARRLAEDYPALRAATFGPDAARSLVAHRRVLPVLDGLDELPGEIRPAVLLRLNESAADPLVLTCRTAEYHAAVTAPGGDALTGGAVIEPVPLTPTDVSRYIAGCLPPGTAGAWLSLLASLRDDPDGPVSGALSTPLALWLLRKVYIDTRADPAELGDANRFPTADAVIEHLLDHLVDALISVNPPRAGEDGHPFRPRYTWAPVDATRWLTVLAQHLTALGSRDLAWWQLYRRVRRQAAVAAGLIAGLTLACLLMAPEVMLGGSGIGLILGPVIGVLFGLVVGFARGATVGHIAGLMFGFNLLGTGVSAGVAGGDTALALTFMLAGGISVAIIAVLVVWAVGFTPRETPAYADLRIRGRTRLLARKLMRGGGGALVLRFTPGFAAGLMYGVLLESAGLVESGMMSGLVFGAVCGSATWFAVGLLEWAETPLTDDRPRTPVTAFRRDQQLVYLTSLLGGAAFSVGFWLQDVLSGPGGASSLAGGIFVAIVIALGVGAHQPSGRYLVTVLVLRARGQLPLRLLRFLEDAHRLGLVRQTGPVYQFRHARLQDHLARKPQR